MLGNDGTPIRDRSDGNRIDDFNSDNQRQDSEGEANVKRFEDDLLRSWDVPNVTPLNTSKLPADQLGLQEMERQLKLFDKELQSVERAIHKLETLLKESESNGSSGRETLSAIRVDLRRIWALKREVESLEASLKAEAGLLKKSLAAKDDEVLGRNISERSVDEELGSRSTSLQSRNRSDPASFYTEDSPRGNPILKGATNLGRGLVNFIFPFSNLKQERDDVGDYASIDDNGTSDYEAANLALEGATTVLQEAETIEQLRDELAALENRIRQAALQAGSERPSSSEDLTRVSNTLSTSLTTRSYEDDIDDSEVTGAYGDVFGKSIEKLKDVSSDAWRGTVLLGSDVGVAVLLLRRSVAGQELTDREQKILKRTFTDLASVIPIGFLMLLPVTAVGHAAILAAIQKYVPALIPSAYGRERLDVLRRLEQLKELESETEDSDTREKASRQ